jgi:hypothetical protein
MFRLAIVGLLASSSALFGQNVVSAQSGTIHYVEGKVLLDGQPVEAKFANFPQIKEKSVLSTKEGRVEVLLTPGVFLRVGENSELRMISTRLVETRLELLSGMAVLEVADLSLYDVPDTAPISVRVGNAAVSVAKKGIYHFNADAPELRVFDGQLEAIVDDERIEVKEGRLLALNGVGTPVKFDSKTGDALLRWSRRRAEYVSLASISAAKSVRDSGGSWRTGGWRYSPYFGLFTFIPARGVYMSPFGFQFWSPYEVYRIYEPRPVYFGGADPRMNRSPGYSINSPSRGGYSGTVAAAPPSVSAPTTSAAGASSAPVSRGSSAGGSRSQ